MPLSNLRILLIDDHHLFLEGMKILLSESVEEVIAIDNAETALIQLPELQPDLILIDLSMPGMDGLSFIKAIESRKLLIPILVVSATENISQVKNVMDAGAFGFIPKSIDRKGLLKALNAVIQGNVYVPESILVRLPVRKEKSIGGKSSYGMSQRQLEILMLLAKGYPNKKISLILSISDDTVKTHLRLIFQALVVSSRTEAVTRALELNLIEI